MVVDTGATESSGGFFSSLFGAVGGAVTTLVNQFPGVAVDVIQAKAENKAAELAADQARAEAKTAAAQAVTAQAEVQKTLLQQAQAQAKWAVPVVAAGALAVGLYMLSRKRK